MSLQLYLRALIVLLALYQMEAKRDFSIEISDMDINVVATELLKSYNYTLYGRKVIYAELAFTKNIDEFDVKVNLDIINKDKSRMSFFKIVANGCESLETAQKSNFLNFILKEAFRVSNLPKKCPLLADTLYTFNNYTVNDDDFPITMPITDWQLKATFMMYKKVTANVTVNGRIRKL